MKRWSLERVGFVLGHIGNFVEPGPPDEELRERMRTFTPRTAIDEVEKLPLAEPQDPRLPELLLERLAPYFDSGALIQRLLDGNDWTVTDVFGRGTTFHLEHDDQITATRLVPEASPLNVARAPARAVLNALELECLIPANDAVAYLFKPTPAVCLVLVSSLAPVFALDHVTAAHGVINDAFLY